jgi:sulfatase maturation enzyme AslB (radical SAM superfamily)
VENHLKSLVEQGAECATCPWQRPCAGYFKWPDPAYSCEGVKRLFSTLEAAADEIDRDLASRAETKMMRLT